jgi:hypothetical protein
LVVVVVSGASSFLSAKFVAILSAVTVHVTYVKKKRKDPVAEEDEEELSYSKKWGSWDQCPD